MAISFGVSVTVPKRRSTQARGAISGKVCPTGGEPSVLTMLRAIHLILGDSLHGPSPMVLASCTSVCASPSCIKCQYSKHKDTNYMDVTGWLYSDGKLQ